MNKQDIKHIIEHLDKIQEMQKEMTKKQELLSQHIQSVKMELWLENKKFFE